jgi:cephalosporin hydroxylase
MEAMRRFVDEHLADSRGRRLRVLDVGSMDINGSYRVLFDNPKWQYTGVDLEPGTGVDVVLGSPYDWGAIPSDSFDIVISGQAFEHMEFPWITALQVTRVLVEGGLFCLIVPSGGYEHRFPLDCWRYYPDGVKALAHWADLDVMSASTAWMPRGPYADDSARWADTVLIARKPSYPNWAQRLRADAKRRALLGGLRLQARLRQTRAQEDIASADEPQVAALAELSAWERRSVELWAEGGWRVGTWMGVPIQQLPQDLFVLQQVIWEQRPAYVVETGLLDGGSAIFYASMLERVGGKGVISVELNARQDARRTIGVHPLGGRITVIEGDSAAPGTVARVREVIGDERNVLVALDSDHSREHVRRELDAYSEFVPERGWLIVFDGIMRQIGLAGVSPGFGESASWVDDNPMQAIEDFLRDHPDFLVSSRNSDLGATFAPRGFLQRTGSGRFGEQ